MLFSHRARSPLHYTHTYYCLCRHHTGKANRQTHELMENVFARDKDTKAVSEWKATKKNRHKQSRRINAWWIMRCVTNGQNDNILDVRAVCFCVTSLWRPLTRFIRSLARSLTWIIVLDLYAPKWSVWRNEDCQAFYICNHGRIGARISGFCLIFDECDYLKEMTPASILITLRQTNPPHLMAIIVGEHEQKSKPRM